MTELSALNVRIYGDSNDLQADLARARGALSAFETQAEKAGIAANRAGGARGAGGLSSGLGRLSNVSGQARGQIQNVSYQLQDMVVQLQMGTRWTTVMAQQVPQLAGGFGALGAAIGILAAVGFSALGLAMASTSTQAETFDDTLDQLRGTTEQLKQAQDILAMSLPELYEQYGLYAEAVRQAARALVELNMAQAQDALNTAVIDGAEALGQYAGAANTAFSSGVTLGQGLLNIKNDFGLVNQEARALQDAFRQLRDAQGFDAQVAAAQNLLATMRELGVPVSKLPADLRAALIQTQQLTIEGANLERETVQAGAAANSLTASMKGAYSQYYATRIEAAGLASETQRAANAFAALQQNMEAASKTYSGRGGDPRTSSQRGFGEFTYTGPALDANNNPIARGGGGGGGGGVNPLVGDLETLQQSLATQTEILNEWYATGLETLQLAREQELLTEQGYWDAKTRLQEQYNARSMELMQEETQMRQQTFSAMGDLLTQFGAKNKLAAKAAVALNAAQRISEIKANTAAAATRALAELGPIAGPPAAARIKAYGAVQAGIAAASAALRIGGGGGGSGGGGGGAATAGGAVSGPPERPLDVMLNTYGPGEFIRGADFGVMLDRLNEVAGDRGYRLMMGT